MQVLERKIQKIVKSPLNYIGGKQKILPQILPLFPNNVRYFVDLFAGGCNVGLNVEAEKVFCNDNLFFLVEMYQVFQKQSLLQTLEHIENRIKTFALSLENEEGYKKMRAFYNENKLALDLFVLIAYSFNHQIRFNNNHEFNNPFGRERSSFNDTMKTNLVHFIQKLQRSNIEFSSKSFEEFNFSMLSTQDFVYCDPPYLITTGTYNDGKRGFTGWGEVQEKMLLQILDKLHEKNIKFALSNVLLHKGKENAILNDWVAKNADLKVHYITHNYANSNYQTLVRDKDASLEVLITNYETKTLEKPKTLFD